MSRAATLPLLIVLGGCSLLVNPRAENEYDLRDAGPRDTGTQHPDAQVLPDSGVDAGLSIPATPVLRFPWNGYMTGSVHTGALPAERNALRPRFVWESSPDAESYEIALASTCEAQTRDTCAFDGALVDATAATEWRPAEALPVSMSAPVGRRYVWRVRACNVAGCSGWSEVRYLDVGRQPTDFNGDGHADLLVGAPAELGRGYTYVFDGADLTTARGVENPADLGGLFGSVVASAGDLTADGFADALVWSEGDTVGSVMFAGRVYRCPRASFGLDCRTGEVVSPTPQSGAKFGWALAAGCDIDGNGLGDFVLGAPQEDVGGINQAGRVYVYLANGGSVPDPVVIESAASEANGHFGTSVDCSSDLDGDGLVDLVVGAAGEAGGAVARAGRVYVYAGGGALTTPTRTLFSAEAVPEGFFGHSVVTADLFGDGVADIVVTAPGEQPDGHRFAGRVHVHDGSPSGGRVLTTTAPVPSEAGAFGIRVEATSSRGSGGLLLVGSLANDGEVWAVTALGDGSLSSPTLLERPAVVTGAAYAFRLATVGDVRGDGSFWFAVGAPLDTDTSGRTRAGSAWTFEWNGADLPTLQMRVESPRSETNGNFGSVGDTSSNTFET